MCVCEEEIVYLFFNVDRLRFFTRLVRFPPVAAEGPDDTFGTLGILGDTFGTLGTLGILGDMEDIGELENLGECE
jgi:hypothetical protein